MRKINNSIILFTIILSLLVALASDIAKAETTFIFPGGMATTGPGAWGGTAGIVYPVAFNVDNVPLTLIVYNLDMSGVKFTKVNPCCGPAVVDTGLGAYAQVGVAADTRVIDWPENGVQMFLTSVMGWNPATDGSGAWNAQATKFTHDSLRGNDDGLGYRKYLQQGWYNPINTYDPRYPWTNDFNKWNFQFNAEKYMGGIGDSEYDNFDLKLEITKVSVDPAPKKYRIEWWVRLHKASSWDESNKTINWGCPWNGAINDAATGTADNENVGLPCIDEVPAETGRVNGAWYRIESPGTPGADFFETTNVDFAMVYPHVSIHNGGASANVGQTIRWGEVVIIGEPILQEGMATGGGWFIAENTGGPGNVTPGGKGTFGFVAKLKSGASSGQLEFQYQTDGLNLKSTSYDWVTVASTQAIFEGIGRLNGVDGYKFRVRAVDGDKLGTGIDRFEIRIWTDSTAYEVPTYRAEGDLSGGQIVVHKK